MLYDFLQPQEVIRLFDSDWITECMFAGQMSLRTTFSIFSRNRRISIDRQMNSLYLLIYLFLIVPRIFKTKHINVGFL